MEKLLKTLPTTTILLVYLYLCGSLYLIGFWNVFAVNIFSLVKFEDIIRSVVEPLIYAIIIFFIFLAVDNLVNKINFISSARPPTKPQKVRYFIANNIDFHIVFAALLISLIIALTNMSVAWFIVCCGLFSIATIEKIIYTPFVIRMIPEATTRKYLTMFIIILPVNSLIVGRANAIAAYNNNRLIYIKTKSSKYSNEMAPMIDSMRLKLLGFLGDKLIISDLRNKKVWVLNQADFEICELESKGFTIWDINDAFRSKKTFKDSN